MQGDAHGQEENADQIPEKDRAQQDWDHEKAKVTVWSGPAARMAHMSTFSSLWSYALQHAPERPFLIFPACLSHSLSFRILKILS
jgi:hypothetical protein